VCACVYVCVCVCVEQVWASAVLVGQMEAAEKNVIKLIGVHPYLSSLQYTLGVGFAAQGRLQEAKTAYRRCASPLTEKEASKYKKHDRDLMIPHCRVGLASLLLKQGINICGCVYMCVYVYACIYVYVCMHMYICICVHIQIYIYV